VGTWHDPDLGRPIAAPLERCAELLGVGLTTVRKLAEGIEPYRRSDGTEVWSLMLLDRQLRPEAYHRRRGGYLERRRLPNRPRCEARPGDHRLVGKSPKGSRPLGGETRTPLRPSPPYEVRGL
jgi:hypothetical protein